MYFGVDYYPEQWEPGMLDEDLDRMVELGCNVIRIGEFAWHLMEPQEGKFDFSFFDRVIAAAGKRGLSVIFGHAHRRPARVAGARSPGHPLAVRDRRA